MDCSHKNFNAFVTVNRLEDTKQFNADIRIECDDCKIPFKFVGLPRGLNLNGVAMSLDGCEARLAILPDNRMFVPMPGPQGFSIKKS